MSPPSLDCYKQSNGMIVRCSSSHKKSLQPFVPIKSYCWMKGKCLPSDHMKNYYKQQSYIKKLSLPNLERSIYMFFKQLKLPFQHKKIPITSIPKQEQKRAKNMFGTLKRIRTYLAREKLKLTLVILMVVMSSALSLLGPYMIGMVIDDFIVTKESAGLGGLLIGLTFIFFMHSLSIFLQNYWMVGIAQQTVYSLRADLFHQFHRLPIAYFDKRQDGDLMSRITNDIDNINNTLNQSVIQILASILTLIGTFSIMMVLSPLLTFVTMSIIPVLLISMR